MRPPTACTYCRARRRKCNVPEPGKSCSYCSQRKVPCSLDPRSKRTTYDGARPPSRSFSSSTVGDSFMGELDSMPVELRIELATLYFNYIHDSFHTLFHPRTFLNEIAEGNSDPLLLLSMIALSARFSNHSFFSAIEPKHRGELFAREAQKMLDLRDISLRTVQACVLIGAFSITEGEAEAECVFYSAACRMARLMDLLNKPVASELEREINVRVWWSLCMIDVWSSTGVGLPRNMPNYSDAPLPIDEIDFLNMSAQSGPISPATSITMSDKGSSTSLLAEMIRLNRVLMEINETNEAAVTSDLDDLSIEAKVLASSKKLDDWHDALPDYMHFNTENLKQYAAQGLGRLFVTLYMGFYHFGQLLYYPYLHQDSYESMPDVRLYAERCKTYSASLCETFYAANSTPGCEVLYTMLGHVLVIASSVQIHTLMFGEDEHRIAAARSRLEQNFQLLTHLRRFWPTLDIVFTRLKAFHASCARMRESSFKMDRWMLKFLSEFARPVDEREIEQTPSPGLTSFFSQK